MIKKLIFNTAKEQFRKALRTHKASVRRNKKTRGLTPIMDYGLLRNKVKRDIKNTKFMDKAAYKAAPKTKSLHDDSNDDKKRKSSKSRSYFSIC
jgi:hypothetical protein